MKTNTLFRLYLAHFFLEWEILQTKVVEKTKTHVWCSITLFQKSFRLWDNVEKNIVERGWPQMTIWSMRNCKHYTYCYSTRSEYSRTHCFSTAAIVSRTSLNVTLFVNCLSCFAYLQIYRQKQMPKGIRLWSLETKTAGS